MKIKVNGITVNSDKEILLADAIRKAGVYFPLVCAGRGVCGKCAVFASGKLSEKSDCEKSLPSGMRLACKCFAIGDCSIRVPKTESKDILSFGVLPKTEEIKGFYAAFDIGTSTIAAVLSKDGVPIEYKTCENPQRAYGADVVSRFSADKKVLKEITQSAVLELLNSFSEKPEKIAVSGNTAMLYLLFGISAEPLCKSPFEITEKFGREMRLGKYDVYVLPCVSAFIGADAVSNVLVASLVTENDSFLSVDVGTNCEVMYHCNNKILCASSAAGSAFEEHGVASELISSLCELLSSGALKKSGAFDEASELVFDGKAEIGNSGNFLSESDIRKLQTDKAAVRTAIDLICEKPELLCLSGAISAYTDTDKLCKIGIIPKCNTVLLGNSALSGALLTAESDKYRMLCEEKAKMCKVINLTENEDFEKVFINNIQF